MNTPSLLRCTAFLAAFWIAIQAHGQSGGYGTYPSGPLSSLYASGYIRVQVPLERAGHYFTLKWQTTQASSVSSATAYYTAFITSGQVTSGNAAGQLQSFLAVVPTPYPTYTYTPYTYTSGGYTYTSYTYTQVPFSAYEWWLTDTTAGQDSQHQLGTPNASSSVLVGAWTQQSGQQTRYFAIPESRRSHSLGMRDGAWTPISASPYMLNTYSAGTSGSTVPIGWFVGSATGPITSSTAYLGDINTGERTNAGATDVRGTTAMNGWSPDPDYLFYPLLDTHVTLHGRELGHKFAVHCKASNTPVLSRVFEAVNGTSGNARLDFQVGTGLPFWITREAENGATNQPVAPAGASVAGSSWVATTSNATFSAVNVFLAAPARPAGVVVPRLVRINGIERSLHSFTVRQGDGYSVTYDAGLSSHSDPVTGAIIFPYVPGSIDTWSGQPVATPLPVHTFTAQVDSRFSVKLRDEITGEEIVPSGNGPIDWVAPWVATSSSAPVGPTITLQLPFTRAEYISFETTRFARPDLANPATGMPYTVLELDPTTPPNPTEPAPFSFSGSPPLTDHASEVFSVTLLNPTPNVPGSFPLIDLHSGDPTPIAVTAGQNDLKTWFTPPIPLPLQISSSRWDHVLRVCHPNGESFPVERMEMADCISEGPGGTVYPQPYYYFTANAAARAEMPWYLEDRSTDPVERILPTGDNLGPTNDELIVWYSLPTPQGLTGVLSTGRRQADLVWAPVGASLEGGFEIERRLSDQAGWTFLYVVQAGDGMMPDGLFHFSDFDLTVGQAHSYRVRYFYGGEYSDYSNEVNLTGWQDGDFDGLPDAWEMAYFGTLAYDADGDPDGDQIPNSDEFNGHSHPNALPANAPGSTLIVYTPLQ